jgi:MFS family permease
MLLLSMLSIASMIDRQMLSVLMQPIKQDLGISDTALGALSGTAFAVFYATAAFPLARWADRGNRPLILSLCLAGWSLATAACGLAQNFLHLALARIGVAVGEASCTPASQSLGIDLYPDRRALVVSIITSSQSLGIAAGLALGGWLASFMPWRHVFVWVGLPGLIIALALWLFAVEPRDVGVPAAEAASIRVAQPPLAQSFALMWRTPTMRWILLVAIGSSITGYGLLIWAPTFFIRVHNLSIAEVGRNMGLVLLIGSVGGSMISAVIGDRLGRRDIRAYGWIAVIGQIFAVPAAIAFLLVGSESASMISFFIMFLLTSTWMGPLYAVSFTLMPVTIRALVSASLTMFINLAGLGIGPILIGAISDRLAPAYGELSLRYGMVISLAGQVVAVGAAFMVVNSLSRLHGVSWSSQPRKQRKIGSLRARND